MQRRIQAVLLKEESTAGEDASPTPADDALGLAGMFSFVRNADVQDPDEVTGALDDAEFHLGRVSAQMTLPLYLKGSGTAGDAPQVGLPLRACAFGETLQATAVPTTGTTTATAGTTNSFDVDTAVDSDWSTTDGAYEGMPVTLSGNPATPVTTIVTKYTVAAGTATVEVAHTFDAALDTSTEAKIEPCAVYVPASTSVPHVTGYGYEDGVVDKLVGAQGTFNAQMTVGQVGRIEFTFTGRALAQADATFPAVTVEATRPPVWKNGVSLLNGSPVGVNGLSISPNHTVVQPDDPNGIEGYDVPQIVGPRRIQGQIDPNRRLVATESVVAAFLNGTTGVIHAQAGKTAGNKYAITCRRAKYRGVESGERGGISMQNIPFSALGSDDETWLTFW
jgi:hypothetical protein